MPTPHDYVSWIKEHYPTREAARTMCFTASAAMVKQFPNLTQVRGWYSGREHWWCVDTDGTVVDPTIHQWTDEPDPKLYVQFREGIDPEPIGICMNCGGYVWKDAPQSYACSKKCDEELARYYEAT